MMKSSKYFVVFLAVTLMLLPNVFGSSTCNINSNGCSLNSITINSIAINSTGKTGKPVYMVWVLPTDALIAKHSITS